MIVIYHNPRCSKSRAALAEIREAGQEPVIIEYLKEGWTRPQLLTLFAIAGITPQEAARAEAKKQGLLAPEVSDEALIEAMLAEPALVERPIVASPKGVAICRPPERVRDLL